ncbi:MAG: GNAT family N-acetyltransferase [Bacteroidales bacterium]|nr:GNAT family N-acetyltransferase [Bacteroidales bacterium]
MCNPAGDLPFPPGKSRKYFVFWLFHLFRIFRNRDYSASLMYKEGKLMASLLVVPGYFKWPFMKKDDLQFAYVMTNHEFRGKGIGEMMLRRAVERFSRWQTGILWYVTDTGNPASIRLCTKVGFEFFAYAKLTGLFRILKVISA